MAAPITDLAQVRALLAADSAQLDPGSRYIRELLAVVDAAADVADLERRLDAGGRGRYWAGDETFRRMSLADKLRVNLITNETSLMRFDGAEILHLRGEVLAGLARAGPVRILSLPCSHGEEAVSLAIEGLEAGLTDFVVQGYDIQGACIETARSGRIPLSGLPRYVVGLVDPVVTRHLRFDVADVFTHPIRRPDEAPWDLIVCRNFLGYFRPEAVRQALGRLIDVLATPGVLLLDAFILSKHPELFRELPLVQTGSTPFFTRPRP